MRTTKMLLAIALLGGALFAFGRLRVSADPNAFPVIGADAVYEPAMAGGLAPDLELLVGQLSDGYLAPIASDSTHWADFTAPTGTLASLIEAIPLTYSSVVGSDSTTWRQFTPPSGTLETLINALPLTYSSVVGSDSTTWRRFLPPSGALETLIAALPRYLFPVQASDSTYFRSMAYPKLLLNDTIPPQITSFTYDSVTGLLEFLTDEFAVNEIWYGDAFNVYTQVFSTTTWVTTHQIILPGPSADYVLMRCADRSGNIYDFYTPGFTIFGAVVDEDDQPIAGVVVSLDAFHVTVTDDVGAYALGGIPTGTYTLSASHSEYDFESVGLSVSGDTEVPEVVGQPSSNSVFLPLVIRGG